MDFMSDFSCGTERPQVINFSGGATGTAQRGTDSTSRKLDTKVWEFKQLYVVCVGNSGPNAQTVWSPGVAKGALTVGNVRDFGFQNVGDIGNSSSRGPTGDGRMKPNVVAPGTVVTSAKAGTTNQYINNVGCSMATPHVSGLAATLMQHYPEFQWQPYLLRSHLMASAMAHDNISLPSDNSSGGRNDYGLGRVSAYVAHWDQDTPNGWFSRQASGTVNSTTWLQYDLDVPTGTERLVIVATWDEPPASAGAKRAVTYDLDLWIDIDADCTPDAIGQCGEFASQSFVDNVEYLIIDNPRPGTYRLKVIPWDAPTFDLPVGLAALIIRGSPAPNMTLAAMPSTQNPRVGSTFTVTTSVFSPSYVASGVQLGMTNLPAGLTRQGVQTTREDGVSMNFNAQVTLGDIIESDTRSAVWTFRADTAGVKTMPFRAWSENGGTRTATVTVTVDGVNLAASPTTIPVGGTLTAAWNGIAAPTSTDWIGLFALGAANTVFVDWFYVSCSKTPGSPRASGSCPFIVPTSVAAGNYELRLLANDGFTRLATSNTFTVTSGQTFALGQARSR
jgi:subtilase family protein